MKNILLVLLAFLVLTGGSCEPDTVIGAPDVYEFEASFTITSLEATLSEFRAQGTVKNTDDEPFYPYWYIEADFYSDSTYGLKFGGESESMNFTLDPGESTLWTIEFGHESIIESDYPNFRIKNLRAYTKSVD